MFYFLLGISAIFAVARFLVPVEGLSQADIFKDLAHLWVGFLFGAAWFKKSDDDEEKILYWILPVTLTVIEVIAFFVR